MRMFRRTRPRPSRIDVGISKATPAILDGVRRVLDDITRGQQISFALVIWRPSDDMGGNASAHLCSNGDDDELVEAMTCALRHLTTGPYQGGA
jgi:hypothetical protein